MLRGEWNGTTIAVTSSADGPCAGLDTSPAEWLAADAGTAWWAAAAEGLRQAVPALARLALAIPETWLTSGADGAARLEFARAALARHGWARVGIVSHPVAVTAWHGHAMLEHQLAGSPGVRRVLVIFLRSGELRGTMCHVTGAAVQAVATSACSLPAAPALDDRAVRHGRERLRVALAAASNGNLAFLEVPVFGMADTPPEHWLTAGQARDLLAGRSRALCSVVRAVLPAVPEATLPSPVTVLMTGPGQTDPLAGEEIADALAESATGKRPALEVPNAQAAAEGAALVAAGQVTAASTPSCDFWLLVHRIADGRPTQHTQRLAGPDEPGSLVIAGADPVTCPIQVDVTIGRQTARLTVPGAETIPAGRYSAGIWPGWSGSTLVLRPVDGGQSLLLPLPVESERDQ